MASWLELVLNIIGYGGFIVLATWHPQSHAEDTHSVGAGESLTP